MLLYCAIHCSYAVPSGSGSLQKGVVLRILEIIIDVAVCVKYVNFVVFCLKWFVAFKFWGIIEMRLLCYCARRAIRWCSANYKTPILFI